MKKYVDKKKTKHYERNKKTLHYVDFVVSIIISHVS